MAKKRKEVRKIVIDFKALEQDLNKPSCFGEKSPYCDPEICGKEWYDKCESSRD